MATSSTSRVSPGSKRTAVPAGTFNRNPYAAARSKARQRFTSKKWQCDPTCTGRSPRLVTSSRRVGRPAFNSMSPSARKYSPGIIGDSLSFETGETGEYGGNGTLRCLRSAYRIVNRHELRAVRERPLDLDLADHLGHAVHHGIGAEDASAKTHDLRHRLAVANELGDFRCDEGDRFRMIELQAASPPLARQLAGRKNQEFVDFAG